MNRKPILTSVLFTLLTWQTGLAGEPEALDILEKAGRAAVEAKAFAYEYTYLGTGATPGHFVGRVKLRQIDTMENSGFRTSGTELDVPPDRAAAAQNFVVATDGSRTFAIDHRARTFTHGRLDQGGAGLVVMAYLGLFVELANPNPYAQLIRENPVWLGKERVAGETCHVIRIDRELKGGGTNRWTWYFSENDFLPRKQVYEAEVEGMVSKYTMEIRNLAVGPSFSAEDFALHAPEGYEVIDDGTRVVSLGSPAPDFRLQTEDGRSVTLSQQRGMVTVLAFFSSSCPICRTFLPKLVKSLAVFRSEEVRFLGVSAFDLTVEQSRRYRKRAGFDFTVLEEGTDLFTTYKCAMIPEVVTIGRDGRIVHRTNGYANGAQVEDIVAAIRGALNGATKPER